MSFRNVIFDLDGTLIDSLPGITASTQYALDRHLPERSAADIRTVIGPPVRTMFATLWPEIGSDQLDLLVAAFREHYDTRGCLLSPMYPGVAETLTRLAKAGTTMFVLTNKPLAPARTILEQHRIAKHFRRIVSPDAVTPPLTRKAEGAELLQHEHQLAPASTIIVGDGMDDLDAAKACSFAFAIAAYGYGGATRAPVSALIPRVKTFSELVGLVL
jgi:phosphoglycolate phosphatase